MLTLTICLLFTNSLAQLNGEFWWLSPKLDQYRKAVLPQFEDLSESETDQSAKIVFRDDDLLYKEEKLGNLKIVPENNINQTGEANKAIKFQDESEIAWPDEVIKATSSTAFAKQIKSNTTNENTTKPMANDIIEIKFPDDSNFTWRDKHIINVTENKRKIDKKNKTGNWQGTITLISDKVNASSLHKNEASETESICTFMKKTECSRLRGIIYVKHESDSEQPYFDTQIICCILPLRPNLNKSKIYFLDDAKPCNRFKRSDKEINPSLKQRNNLLLKKFGSQSYKPKLTTASPIKHRVVTPSDEYIDPYWNIKGSKNPSKQKNPIQLSTKYEYETEDYIEDYVVELPSPGLVGLYSDHSPSVPSWTFPTEHNRPYGGIDSEEDTPNFGYTPTVDPRFDERRVTKNSRVKGRPVKLSTTSDERTFDADSQTISYHSNPDFQVLQGFKLLNLVRNKSRIFRNGKKTTTEKIFDSGSRESVLLDTDYDDDLINKNCGRAIKGSSRFYGSEIEIGEAEKGSHPSLALVVLTKRKQSVLCYATIVHPKAAISAADCFFGRTTPGEIMLIAGVWRLDDESHEGWQKRMTSLHIHPQYKPSDLAHNLALLYWKRPLRLNANVQPACVGKPHVGDDCKFFGWGGYDQAIRKQSRWQRAVVLAQRTCAERISNKRLPPDAFCASVQSRGTVTGIGGALMCNVGGHHTAIGIAVWRDLAVVLIPVHDWLINTLNDLDLRK